MHAPLAPTAEILFSRLREKARASRKRLVFPEGNDARIIAAAEQLEREGLADTVLLTEPVLDESLAEIYFQRQRAKGVSREEAQRTAAQPLFRAALMVASGRADGAIGGVVNTTGDTVRAALQCIEPAPGVGLVSSAF